MTQNGSEQRMDQLAGLVRTSTTETMCPVADNSRQIAEKTRAIANNNQRIEQILEYLFRQSGNGRSEE